MKGGQVQAPPKARETGERTIHLAPEDVETIERYRAGMAAMLGREPIGWLLSYDGGTTPLRAKGFTERLGKLAKDNGMAGVTPHSLRRHHSSELIAADVDVGAAAAEMGHRQTVMLSKYVKAADDKRAAAATAVRARRASQGFVPAELLAPTNS